MSPETEREIAELVEALARLAATAVRALADGLLTLDEVVALVPDVGAVGVAIAALARPEGGAERRAELRSRVAKGRAEITRRRRRAARLRRLQTTRKVLPLPASTIRIGSSAPSKDP